MQTISFKVPPSLSLRLVEAARRQNRSKSEVIREAVDIYLRGDAGGATKSALDGIEDLVGIFEGPGDLSTNKAYLEDFGS